MKITIVRHTSVACGPEMCYGQTDVEVANSFLTEAELVKQKLAGFSFSEVYSSPLQRCTKLAAYCGFEHPTKDNRLMELNFGDWEGILWSEITDPHLANWYNDWMHTKTTNGESFMDQIERVKAFFNELINSKKDNILVFTHAGVIRATAILLQLVEADQAFSDFKVEYGQVIEFLFSDKLK